MLEQEYIVGQWLQVQSMPSYTDKRKFRTDHIFDEDQTVRWNKEAVEAHNRMVDEENQLLRELKHNELQKLNDLIIRYICQEWPKITKTQATKLFRYVSTTLEDSTIEVILEYIDEICECFFVED